MGASSISIPHEVEALWIAIWHKTAAKVGGCTKSSVIEVALKALAKTQHPGLYKKHIKE